MRWATTLAMSLTVTVALGCDQGQEPRTRAPAVSPKTADDAPVAAATPPLPALPRIEAAPDLPTIETKTVSLRTVPTSAAIADDGSVWLIDGTREMTVRRIDERGRIVDIATMDGLLRAPRAVEGTPDLRVDSHAGPRGVIIERVITPAGEIRDLERALVPYQSVKGVSMGARVDSRDWHVRASPSQLHILGPGAARVDHRIDRAIGAVEDVVAAEGYVLVADERNGQLLAVDADGHARTVAAIGHDLQPRIRLAGGSVLVDGTRAMWIDRDGEHESLMVVHRHGGRPQQVLRMNRQWAPRIAAAYRGRAVVVMTGANIRYNVPVRKPALELRILSVPAPALDPAAVAGFNAPRGLEQLPVRESTREALRSWGVTSLYDLENRASFELRERIEATDAAVKTELRYAMAVFERGRARDEPIAAPQIASVYLTPIEELGVEAALTATLRDWGLITFGLLAAERETDVERMLTRTMQRADVDSATRKARLSTEMPAIKAALKRRDLVLGTPLVQQGLAR